MGGLRASTRSLLGIFRCGRSKLSSSEHNLLLSCLVMADPISTNASDSSSNKNATRLGQLARDIIPHILNLYNCKASALDFEVYAPDATFEDPLMRAYGVKQIKSAFYSIPKVFSEGRMGNYTVEEHETAPGSGEIKIDNIQHYKFLGRQFDMVSLIKLQVENGKVVRHEDLWNKKPLWSRETVKFPLVGRTAEGVRRGNMLLTHVLMGRGKDATPS